ncbi:aldehyde dehydrogenase (NADP(+)) [Sediminibacterium roseum]|uniref:Aldehyde dehydrogenase (NADP(+)) n=1 Tax=Sediminibacterium roseum TaxID=1978412 RepID=A0ABW9ZRN1_9BACT|nr:aldehyde dehydrogenase (NADP(+)) [Sediminibacterium roseum]NCI49614.1 aldehyde dehydrogenase (NADP(+)) [Sediminibacterium roseum]
MINKIMQQSAEAFVSYRKTSAESRAVFLETIAANIESLGEELIGKASEETNLPAPRLTGERGRTTMQLRMFAQMLREGSWVEASIDTANPDKVPAKPDLRKMLIPMGPVVVFGASNFPFAYSTAGGDTASALAAGCTVVVKGHPAHLQTSTLVAGAIEAAIVACNMPAHTFQHVTDSSFEAGKALVQHDETAAVGFTGSYTGGRALWDYAAARKNPIPVFSEMGSINPVVLLPDTLDVNTESVAKQYAGSITLGMGQFCTNPGLLIAIQGEGLNRFLDVLSKEIDAVVPAKMLHKGIHKAYFEKMEAALNQKGVKLVARSSATPGDMEAQPSVATVEAGVFLEDPLLHEEVFGPYSLLVICKDEAELKAVWRSLTGQLTTTLMGTDKDFATHHSLLDIAPSIAGRIVFNGVPTGVDVSASMVHGGPYPASTDSRFTAVGVNAVKRWVRPVCYQSCPDALLPDELKAANPLGIWRLVDNVWKKD